MKAFIDTSTLIKKYVIENGSDEFDTLLEGISEIIISSIYYIEVTAAIDRRLREKSLTQQNATRVQKEIREDYKYFTKVLWNERLEQKALELIRQHHLKTLDSVQLASGSLSGADIFIVSDQKLFTAARKEIKNTRFI
jgi:predicted nucleic acid-binding protein